MLKPYSSLMPVCVGLMALVCTACQGNRGIVLPLPGPEQDDATLTIEAKPPINGEVLVVGETNLPPNTQLTALALRYLEPTQTIGHKAEPTFAILDYQTTTVEAGQWEATLDLWQVADDGQYQEAWQPQIEQLNLKAEPGGTVHFVITLAPRQFLATLRSNSQANRLQFSSTLLRTTADGEALLWADDAQPVALPQGRTNPPGDLAQRVNGGWGERYRLVPEPPLPYTLTPEDTRKTTAPPRPGEFLQ
jgi:hypothetical protein